LDLWTLPTSDLEEATNTQDALEGFGVEFKEQVVASRFEPLDAGCR
jgi:hypothetical protein